MGKRKDRSDTPEEATIRAAVRRAVAERGVRAVSREIGIVPTNLTQIVEGSHPYPRTWDKLRAWAVRAGEGKPGRGARGTDTEAARAAVELLVQRVPTARQEHARARLVALLGEVAAEPGLPAPAWLAGIEGGAEAYAAAPPASSIAVDLRGGRQVEIPAPEDVDTARAVAEGLYHFRRTGV